MLSWWACEPDEAADHPFIRAVQAIRESDTEAVAALLQGAGGEGSNLNFTPTRPLPSSLNPLAVEATLRHEHDILEMLLDQNPAVLAAVDVERSASLLHIAAESGDSGIASMLLLRNPQLVRAVDAEGYYSLHYAAMTGRRAIIPLLVSAGSDVNARAGPSSGATALFLAAASGHDRCVECLLTHSADVAAADVEGRTPLLAAAAGGHSNIVRRLLACGADPAVIDAAARRTALHWAAYSGAVEAVEALLEATGNALVNAQDVEEETALLVASRRGIEPIVRLLLSQRAAVELANRHGITPIMAASLFGHSSVVNDLLGAGALVAAADPVHGRTCLHLAALGGRPEVVRILVSAGAARDLPDATGLTPGQLASEDDVIAALARL